MAYFCRSALQSAAKSLSAGSTCAPLRTVIRSKPASSPFSSPTRAISSASRLASVLGIAESQKPLHSAVASARLKSIIAMDSSCWSWLSQGLALPL